MTRTPVMHSSAWLRLALLGLVVTFLVAAGCRGRTPQLRPLDAAATVLAFGDSLTYGTGAPEGQSYPDRLQELLGRPVINAGVPGEVTAEGLARLPGLLDRHRPLLLVLCHGGNDLLRRTGDEQAAANLRAMVRLARERGVDVVLLGVPTLDLRLSPPDFYGNIAREFDLPYDGDILAEILADRDRKSDHIHPNARGYAQIATAVTDLLHRAGAL